MMIDGLFVDEWVILAATAPIQSVTAAKNLATLHRTVTTRLLPLEHHAIKTDLIQGINILTPKGTEHTPPTVVTDMGDISAGHNNATILTVTGAAAFSEGTHHAPHPVTTMAHAALWLLDAPIAICTVTHQTDSHTPSNTHQFSCRCHSCHYSTDWRQSHSSNSNCTAQETQPMRNAKPHSRPPTLHKSHCDHPGLPIKFFLRFRQ